ncbi:hypothetical protein [Planktothrix mougeotii]|uniref:FtsK domain-containing protein n=1 Tax=Planktothrix mougeotii LEGE 06226 TaxID=1828728 RepID=A0ABR9UEQ2_9CYAN|nr:hypothetical protein [Planktothrix mougeotii]MBE9144913.1 hypothetical protein [Planktothrix mougeotii LEGE 06226]
MSNILTISSGLWIATGTLGMIWGLSQPYPSPNKFYGFGMGAIAASIGTALTYPAMKRTERSIIRQDTCDTIYDIGEAAVIERYKQAVFPTPRMPDLTINNHILGMMGEPSTEPSLEFYNWEGLSDEASGILIGGNSGSAKTSLGAGFVVGKLTAVKPAEVIVLDIHASKNPIWQQMGFPRIESDVESIYQILCWLIDEVERRKYQEGNPLIICLDEINDTISELAQLDIVKPLGGKEKRVKTFSYAIRKLSNARKFDICLLGFMQSHNTEAIGIDGKFRNNFLLVLCGASARGEIQNIWKHDDPRFLYIQNTAYPVVISGSNSHTIAQHPTHSHHSQYRKKGNAPSNLIAPRFLSESSIPVYDCVENFIDDEPTKPKQPPKTSPNSPSFDIRKLEKKPENDSNPDDRFMQILAFCKGKESVSVRDVQRSSIGRDLSSQAIRYAFEWLEKNGHGTVSEEQTGGTVKVSFTPN